MADKTVFFLVTKGNVYLTDLYKYCMLFIMKAIGGGLMVIDETTLEYISALRVRTTLAEAVSTLSVLANAVSQGSCPEKHTGQLVLDLEMGAVLVSDPPAVAAAKQRLQKSARMARVSNVEEKERWDYFLTIVLAIGLAQAIQWLLWYCPALCVSDNESPYDRTQAA